jgi:DNA (cytosine-5)-methyltransferase 1
MPTKAAARYNEIEAYAAAWLRNLIALGELPDGVVDERSIVDVRGDDLAGYNQCHFFAGIGVWARALRDAGWPEDKPVWTGSCPCQPFSSAARGRNVVEDLWPAWRALIVSSRPGTIFGEQVANDRGWFDRLCDDLEPLDYAIGAAVLPAVSVGKDHLRYRLFFVCHANGYRQPSMSFDGKMASMSRDHSRSRDVAPPHGPSARMERLRAYGNAIVLPVARAFVECAMEALYAD